MINKIKSKLLLSVVVVGSVFKVSAADLKLMPETNFETDRIVLASLIFSNGNRIKFGQLPASDEMYVEELVELGDGEIFILDHLKGNLIDKYLAVTPPGTPVPNQLITFEQEHANETVLTKAEGHNNEVILYEQGLWDKRMALLAGRQVVDRLDAEVFVDWSELNPDRVSDFNKAAGQGSCNNSTGYLYFIDHHCNLSGNHGSGSSQTHCDYPMQFGAFQRTSSSRVRSTYSRVVNCELGDAAIVHSKKTGNTYYEQATWFVGVNKARGVETWAGKYSLRKNRRVNVLKVTPGGYVRAWTKFSRNSK